MIKIKMYPAKEGDAFLISLGEDSEINILIDMGLSGTFECQIKSDLIELSKLGRAIDLLVVTHIDQDHIQGAIHFIKENGPNHKIIQVKEVWHNSYRHLQFDKRIDENLSVDEINILNGISAQNSISERDGTSEISIDQGVTLAALLYAYNYNWNATFGHEAVRTPSNVIEVAMGVKLRLLSPNEEKLNILARIWKKKLESEAYGFTLTADAIFDDAFELYVKTIKEESVIKEISSSISTKSFHELIEIEQADSSVTNGSSIAFIIEYNDKKLLFLADSHEDIIYQELEKLKNEEYALNFDVVKISHHGSNKNISNKLLELFSAKKFIISTDGSKHEHPDLECVAKIINAKYDKEIITNYPLSKLEYFSTIGQGEIFPFTISSRNELVLR